jgi:hypothetical protein
VAIADGAYFRGSIDMQRTGKPAEAKKEETRQPAVAASAQQPAPAVAQR